MIAKEFRVPREKISYILKKGQEAFSELFIIRYSDSNADFNRFRTIVSRKIDKSAVKRNTLRRQIYEAIRLHIKENNQEQSLDIILIPKKSILKASLNRIQADIKRIPWTN